METLTGPLKIIEDQIESCKKLLSVFQEERGIYNQGRSLSKEELANALERKLQLVNLFERQRSSMKSMVQEQGLSEEQKLARKGMLRNLASLLEQLIIIDQDNERLMREAATTTRRPQPLSPFAARQRPALQMQLPLMPFGQSASAAAQQAPKAASVQESAPAAAMAKAPALSQSASNLQAAVSAATAIASQRPRQELRAFKAPTVTGTLPLRPKSHLRVYGASHPANAAANA